MRINVLTDSILIWAMLKRTFNCVFSFFVIVATVQVESDSGMTLVSQSYRSIVSMRKGQKTT